MLRFAFASLALTACLPGFDPIDTVPDPEVLPPEPPAPETSVTVVVRDGGAPVPGVAVVFQAADDRVLADLVTDATGTAIAELPDGGNATVIRSALVDGETRTMAYTVADAKPGDVIELAAPAPPVITPVTVSLQLPAAGQFTVITSCGTATGGPSTQIQLTGCGTETDFFVVNNQGRSFLARRPITPTIDMSTETLRDNRDIRFQATNVDPALSITLEKRLLAGSYSLFSTGQLPGPAMVTAPAPDIGTAAAEQLVVARLAKLGRNQDIAARAGYTMNDTTLEVGASLIPFVDPATFDGSIVTWTQDGTGTPDFAIVTVVDGSLTRIVAAPIAAPTLKLPSFAAARGIDVGPDALVSHRIAKVTGGYDAIRAAVFAHGSLLEAAPANATLAISTAP